MFDVEDRHLAIGADVPRREKIRVDPRERCFGGRRRLDAVEKLGEGARILWAHGVEDARRVLFDQADHPF